MSIVAVIPARGGSKRIPRKNLVDFRGKPIIAYSIQSALDSGVIDRVIVSTDDPEIAATAQRYGAECPFVRPPELSDDHTGIIPVVGHAVRWLTEVGQGPDLVCCIFSTAPLLSTVDLRTGFETIKRGDWRYVFSAAAFRFPVFRGFTETNSHGVKMLYPEHATTRSQDLSEVFHDAGQFYWGQTEAWINEEPIFAESSTFVRLPAWRVQDIDSFEDLERARLIHSALAEGVRD